MSEKRVLSSLEPEFNSDGQFFAVLVRTCSVTNAVDTMLFPDSDFAKTYCAERFGVLPDKWEPYMVANDSTSTMLLNGKSVSYCGWKFEMDETEMLHIHTEREVVAF